MQNNLAPISPYLTPAEAATHLNVAARTLRDYARKFKIPKYGPFRNRYKVEDLDAFMADPSAFLTGRKTSPKNFRDFTPVRV